MNKTLIERIIDIYPKKPRVAILMSGKGSNAQAILSAQKRYPNINFIAICTDKPSSNASKLSKQFNLSYFSPKNPIANTYERQLFFQELTDYLVKIKIDTIIYAGFMKICPPYFIERFPGINVHPADLTICNDAGKPKFVGMHAIRDAIESGEMYLASTAHIVDHDVDCGQPIMISNKLHLDSQNTHDVSLLHEKLKKECEHQLYPFVIESLARGYIKTNRLPYLFDDEVFFSNKLLELNSSSDPLTMAYKAQDYSSRVRFDFSHIDQVMEKVKEEFHEMMNAYQTRTIDFDHFIEELGDCFFALTNLCRFANIHPNEVMQRNVEKYLKRCQFIETNLKNKQRNWLQLQQDEIINYWKMAKENE